MTEQEANASNEGARQETMPEYIRVKNRTLDLYDDCQLKLKELNAVSLTHEVRALAGQKPTPTEQNALTDASKGMALSLMELYAYLRPKLRISGKFTRKYQLLGRMEKFAWASEPLLKLAADRKYMMAAFNKMREFLEEIKLTQFEKQVLKPWQRLAQGMTSRKR